MGGVTIEHQLPPHQRALILQAPGPTQSYEVVEQWPLPLLEQTNEVLIRVEAVGLNPVDWKSVIYGFALPTLPAITGRDLSGIVVKIGSEVTRFKIGDRVYGPSTQYRDYRTSAFQEYAIAMDHCLGRVPESLSFEEGAAIGVGAVTALLAVTSALGTPIREFAPRGLSIGAEGEHPDWKLRTAPPSVEGQHLLIWGASTVTGYFAAQFGKLAGLTVIAVADEKRHGKRLRDIGIENVVDRSDPIAAIAQVRAISNGGVRYALDCVGKDTLGSTLQSLADDGDVWLVGLSGLPKGVREGVNLCEVPVKTFHTNPAVGRATMNFLEELFVNDELSLPPVEVIDGGLDSINSGLARLRAGDHGFGRLVVRSN